MFFGGMPPMNLLAQDHVKGRHPFPFYDKVIISVNLRSGNPVSFRTVCASANNLFRDPSSYLYDIMVQQKKDLPARRREGKSFLFVLTISCYHP